MLADRLSSVRLPFLVVPLFVLAASAIVGNAAAPALLANRPLLLLALNSTTRHLLLTSTSVDVVPYAAVALARRSLEDPLLYLLGWRYGDTAVAWTAEHLGGARALGWLQRNFRRFGWLLVALFPGGVVCVMAGAARMGLVPFVLVGLAGTVATIAAIRASGETLPVVRSAGLRKRPATVTAPPTMKMTNDATPDSKSLLVKSCSGPSTNCTAAMRPAMGAYQACRSTDIMAMYLPSSAHRRQPADAAKFYPGLSSDAWANGAVSPRPPLGLGSGPGEPERAAAPAGY